MDQCEKLGYPVVILPTMDGLTRVEILKYD